MLDAPPCVMRAYAPSWYDAIELYDPQRPPCRIDLSDNTNLWGPSPIVSEAIRTAMPDLISRYPTPYVGRMKSAIAGYLGIDSDWVVTGCGSDDVLDFVFRTFLRPGDRIGCIDPGFAYVSTLARVLGLRVDFIPLMDSFDLDVASIDSQVALIYLAIPNNPTGTEASDRTLRALLDRTSALLVIDQAYAEFSENARVPISVMMDHPDRVVLIRTFSKVFGLAGLRAGYAVGHPSIAKHLERTRGPYKVGALTEHACITALTLGRSWVDDTVAGMRVSRSRFVESLSRMGRSPIPSQANFVLLPSVDSIGIAAGMRARDVLVRVFKGLDRIGDALRITIGPWPMMEECLRAMEEVQPCA